MLPADIRLIIVKNHTCALKQIKPLRPIDELHIADLTDEQRAFLEQFINDSVRFKTKLAQKSFPRSSNTRIAKQYPLSTESTQWKN